MATSAPRLPLVFAAGASFAKTTEYTFEDIGLGTVGVELRGWI